MKKCVILVGPPGSGKSTFAKSLETQEGYTRISQDDQGKSGHIELFLSKLASDASVVIDRMNFDKAQRDKYRLEAVKHGYEVSFVEFCVPRQVCFDRMMAREGHPTINGFLSVYDQKTETTANLNIFDLERKSKQANSALTTYFSKYEPVEEGPVTFQSFAAESKREAIMCDLDGTLANLNHRLHYVRREGKKDWGSFFRECGKDTVYPCVAGVVAKEMRAGTDVVYCSGRDETACREATVEWLKNINLFNGNALVMRPKLNYKADNITKIMLYRYEIEPYYDIKYVLDDRDQVVQAWRKIGLVCFQVRPGDF